ncbi:uncharacterized protein LOC113492950 isoform X2 [Trichoplusia ni]|uniref:Uncharacterized protein LOC113492950 isoform X2 n=1 Tax=Trichoplusia ni TaxID=7111 RepID=A0A7E5VDW7_TRINI|nr:uncharacterized protein LOC113492950 isoform X2 [Trichoplusia ni]
MMTNTKQVKITKLFRKGATKLPEDCDELQEEVQQLELKLKEKQDELFQLQRNSYRHKASPPKRKPEVFTRPQKIVLSNALDRLGINLELMSVLTGIEVQSYVLQDHCCITYHMQHDTPLQIKHGLRIDLKSGINEVSKSSLPLGFNLDAVMEDFDNIMLPECLGAIRKALVAYYNRLEQFEALKKMLNIEAQLFKILDGSHIEVSFVAKNEMDEDAEPFDIVLMLDYRVYDIRPKQFSFKEIDLPDGAADVLREQCVLFKRKPLPKAFREAFIDGAGLYKLVEQVGTRPAEAPRRRNKRFKPNKHNYNNDDTFLPEDCSEHSDIEAE